MTQKLTWHTASMAVLASISAAGCAFFVFFGLTVDPHFSGPAFFLSACSAAIAATAIYMVRAWAADVKLTRFHTWLYVAALMVCNGAWVYFHLTSTYDLRSALNDRREREQLMRGFYAEGRTSCSKHGYQFSRLVTSELTESPGFPFAGVIGWVQCGKTERGEFVALADVDGKKGM